ncbi:FHA domain-containing protein [Hydrobacter penzbergensis]|jgi:pSer/pThr/pTyr-binding forkhead associated (FHA) protein|uniref:FHA domain-containing protein n=1 Tax=Hydrobacter penzbergensis TaxID=1235997 RepID=A0A8X8ICS1_9BACT|nr:FHA domain-containing protein [Hydrobacter penzbergensis]MBN8720350.1 FHA domain-containing protein [Sediminibacterium magnilacihabitans]PQV59758.1 FHA domain-containing protein [Sediminibacterium magnilacihabitans]SDW26033.1 FHA domain-containing protein [Hydrobacter penzbergensis]
MTRNEVLEFLELPESASDADIRVRLNDKLAYFQRLSENAPNEFLRQLHIANTEKVKQMRAEFIGAKGSEAKPASTAAKTEIGWLIRHTENQSAKTFPLYYGKNYIGRNSQPGSPTIVLDDDPYVSRTHALLEVTNVDPLQIVISDDATGNGGKPSKNGTYINGNSQRIAQKVTIGNNDTIQVGVTKLIIRLNNTSIHKIVQEVEESEYMKTVVIDVF